ncbi:beta-lactamase-like protein [Aspergillus taichungensis]|uniref:Beta-lactamase-like protein n=1 Tax=Aspergillus taichungensis TaxID=482145 RepID=A0A2J5HSU2_9EURO|nr:beta-lactamase-like protein [Aspergillus taichungensis]
MELDLPQSDHTVRVRLVDTTTVMTVDALAFVDPVQKHHEHLNLTDVAFLIENDITGERVMFDLGTRKDYWNLPPITLQRGSRILSGLRIDQDVTEVLEGNGVELDTISSIIWSHYHWDHTGNPALFPPSTTLVVGPGVTKSPVLLPGYPENPNSVLSAEAFADRRVIEVNFDNTGLTIGGFRATDFFGDGSFYLLDTPGHCLGHMCALARTTKDTFAFLGGDICHFVGDFRPTPAVSLPEHIPDDSLDQDPVYFPAPCPCSLFTDQHPIVPASSTDAKTTPFYKVSSHATSVNTDPATAQKSVDKLRAFDASPSVLVCLAHDPELLRFLPTFNETPSADINGWKENGVKDKVRWGWLNELPRGGRPGRLPLVEGLWRDGRLWEDGKAELCRGQ